MVWIAQAADRIRYSRFNDATIDQRYEKIYVSARSKAGFITQALLDKKKGPDSGV